MTVFITSAESQRVRNIATEFAAYLILVRSPDDPNRMTRAERQKRFPDAATKWRIDLRDDHRWREIILRILANPDIDTLTFNALCLIGTAYEYTADVAFRKAPERALWQLVDESIVEHTRETPLQFRLRIPPTCERCERPAVCTDGIDFSCEECCDHETCASLSDRLLRSQVGTR